MYRSSGGGRVNETARALAYAVSRMPATFAAVFQALAWSYPGARFLSLSDIGAGTGAACWAANELNVADRYALFERENAMLDTGARLMREAAFPAPASFIRGDLLSDALPEGELVISAYVLGELSAPDREIALRRLYAAASRALTLLWPGTPEGFKQMRSARDFLLSLGAHLVAPCPALSCPLPDSDWCHFSARVQRGAMHRRMKEGDSPFEDEKFCYISVSRSSEFTSAKSRVLRHPAVSPGQIELSLCERDGLNALTVRKNDKEAFRAARKVKWGDEWGNDGADDEAGGRFQGEAPPVPPEAYTSGSCL